MTARFYYGPTVQEDEHTKSFKIVCLTEDICDGCKHWLPIYDVPFETEIGYCNEESSDHFGHIIIFDHPACRFWDNAE